MTPEELQELKEKAELWDSLSPTLRTQFAAKFPYSETLQNTSNASSHIGVLEEESKDMVSLSKDEVIVNDVKTFLYKKESELSYNVEIKTFIDGSVSFIFSANCGKHGTSELIDDYFVITTKELLVLLKVYDAKV